MTGFDEIKTNVFAFDPVEMERRKLELAKFVLPESGMRFLDDHFGPRPGCIHSLMGSTGRGKSTLVQSLILKWGTKANILLYLSEESLDRIEVKLWDKNPEADYLSAKLHSIEEREFLTKLGVKDTRGFLYTIEERLNAAKAKLLIVDNITTSQFYEGRLEAAMPILSGLKGLAEKYQIPVFLVCHTKKGVNETTKGLMLPDDVRGSAQLPMTSDYFYTFYRVRQTSEFGTSREGAFVYVSKARDHDNQDEIYRLNYEVSRKLYVSDTQVNFNVFKEFMRERDRA